MNADGSEQLKFVEGGAELLDRIELLWKQQTALHAEKSLHFAESFTTASFSDRKSVFEQKARTGILLVKGTALTPSGERFSRISAYAVENHNQEGAPSQARE